VPLVFKARRGLTTGSLISPEERSANAGADDECPDSGGDSDATLAGYAGDCEILTLAIRVVHILAMAVCVFERFVPECMLVLLCKMQPRPKSQW